MKIQKFNENLEQTDFIISNYCYCSIRTWNENFDDYDDISSLFYNEEDMKIWLLNELNIKLQAVKIKHLKRIEPEYLHENEKGQKIFINYKDAIEWFMDWNEKDHIIYETNLPIHKNVKYEFGAEVFLDVKNFNL